MIKILFICHGNICRSTMAEYIFKDMVRREGLENDVFIDSAATSREELGRGIYPPAARELQKHGIPTGNHRARQITKEDYASYDYLIGMERMNISSMMRLWGSDPDGKVHKMLEFAGTGGDIDDPWYTGQFHTVYSQLSAGCQGLLEEIKERLWR